MPDFPKTKERVCLQCLPISEALFWGEKKKVFCSGKSDIIFSKIKISLLFILTVKLIYANCKKKTYEKNMEKKKRKSPELTQKWAQYVEEYFLILIHRNNILNI